MSSLPNGHTPPAKVALITGAASGIGFATAQHFASEGYRIAILDFNEETGTAATAQLSSEFPETTVTFAKCDVSSWQEQAAAFKRVYEMYGCIDVVMANAGISEQDAVSLAVLGEQEPTEPSLRTLNVNLVGVMYSIKLAIYYLQKNSIGPDEHSRGSIICTASNAGLYPFPMAPIYAATKAGVINLVRSLSRPLERAKIQINALAPSVLQTNIASADLFKSMKVTPMSTLTKGVAQLVSDPSLTGRVAEIHGESVTLRAPPEWVDEDSKTNLEMFWTLGYA